MKLPHTINTEVAMQSYHHFTLSEREILSELRKEEKSVRQIAKILNKSASTISREINRNKNKNESYHPWRATVLYIIRRHKSVRKYRLETDKEVYQWVCEGLDQYWSPEIIAERWKMKKQNNKLSHTTIYAAMKKGKLQKYRPQTHLRRHGKRKSTHQSATIHPEHLIREWPDEIINRACLGHWEGDTVLGGINKGALVTCVDRKSRYLAVSLVKNKTAEETSIAMKRALSGQIVRSLSLDNGSEFANFKQMERQLGAIIYFADPHSPWQRGSNENINNLIRFFFPKGTNFHEVTQEDVDNVLYLINNRPRKCLGWLSPIEFMSKCCT